MPEEQLKDKIRSKLESILFDKILKAVCSKFNFSPARFTKWLNSPENE